MRESSKSCTSVNGTSTSGPIRSASTPRVNDPSANLSNDALRFEVLYMGKLRMSYKKAPMSFIDEAIEKFKLHETEKVKGGTAKPLKYEETSDDGDGRRRSSSQVNDLV